MTTSTEKKSIGLDLTLQATTMRLVIVSALPLFLTTCELNRRDDTGVDSHNMRADAGQPAKRANSELAHDQDADRTTAGNIVVNGSFELGPPLPNYFLVLKAGNGDLAGWSVGGTSVDIVDGELRARFAASDGRRSIDLDGSPGPGSIEQLLPTHAGATYRLSFDLNGNAEVGSINVKKVQVNAADVTKVFQYDVTQQTSWESHSFEFVAASEETKLDFLSLGAPGSIAGALLDNVKVSLIQILVTPE